MKKKVVSTRKTKCSECGGEATLLVYEDGQQKLKCLKCGITRIIPA